MCQLLCITSRATCHAVKGESVPSSADRSMPSIGLRSTLAPTCFHPLASCHSLAHAPLPLAQAVSCYFLCHKLVHATHCVMQVSTSLRNRDVLKPPPDHRQRPSPTRPYSPVAAPALLSIDGQTAGRQALRALLRQALSVATLDGKGAALRRRSVLARRRHPLLALRCARDTRRPPTALSMKSH